MSCHAVEGEDQQGIHPCVFQDASILSRGRWRVAREMYNSHLPYIDDCEMAVVVEDIIFAQISVNQQAACRTQMNSEYTCRCAQKRIHEYVDTIRNTRVVHTFMHVHANIDMSRATALVSSRCILGGQS
jgi:hypothetical protein